MNISQIKTNLNEKGYVVIPNIMNAAEVESAKEMFFAWKSQVPNHDLIHYKCDPHGIYKYLQVGHQRHAWYIRTRPAIQDIFKELWNTDELIVSFDGCCYIPKYLRKKDQIWTHTDQESNNSSLKCFQAYVALTENKERTIVVYEGSHLKHEAYFAERGIKSSKKWNLIDHDYLETIADTKRVLHVPAGAMVIWDSRTFHQNQYGEPDSEERLVQYVCYLPKDHKDNKPKMIQKRRLYFDTKRTTSHWPAPINVNALQPRNYGDNSSKIDYENLNEPDLGDMIDDINKLL